MIKNVIFDLMDVLLECNYKQALLKYFTELEVQKITKIFFLHKKVLSHLLYRNGKCVIRG